MQSILDTNMEQLLRLIEDLENIPDEEITEENVLDMRFYTAHYEILKSRLN